MALCPRVTTFPPLGKITVLEEGLTEVQISATIEWERERRYPFEAELLYADATAGGHPKSWAKTSISSSSPPSTIREQGDACLSASFTDVFPLDQLSTTSFRDGPVHVKFTVQYRQNKFDAWKLVRAPNGVEVGELIVPSTSESRVNIADVMSLEDGWDIKDLAPTDGVPTWQLSSSTRLSKSQADDTELVSEILARVNNQSRFMAVTRIEPFWIGCEHDREYFYLDNDGVLISFLNKSGLCITLFAFNGVDDFYTVFRTGPNGSIQVAGRNDSTGEVPLRVLVSVSSDKQRAIAAVMSQARQIASSSPKLEEFINTCVANGDKSPEPSFFSNLGYCTWNGLGQDLTRAKLLDGLETLAANKVKFNTLLIDDNWQSLGKTSLDFSNPGFRGWSRFEANDEGFPRGLACLITEIKSKYPHIQYVGVWHALFGYWGGLAHDSEFKQKYKTRMVQAKVRLMTPTDVLIIDPEDVHRFYDDFYAFLRSCGIDFVKTDVQHMLGLLIDPKDRADVPSAYQSAWTSAYLKHFNGRAISCMSQIPQISWHSFLQDKTPKILLRNSDDFFPEIPGSHPFHLFVNAHNALVTRHLNCLPDWDMFQTSHAYSSYHGAARAISGGPVLITDTPGHHDVGLINEMTALSPSGERVAIRPGMATTVDMWDAFAAAQILKIGASTDSGAGILGLFNIAEGQREGLIPVHDLFGGQQMPTKTLIRSYRTGQMFLPQTPIEKLIKVKLQTRGWDVLTGFPLREVNGASVAVLGLVDKISGAAAVVKYEVANGTIELSLKALGKLGLYIRGDKAAVGSVIIGGEHRLDADAMSVVDAVGGGKLFTVDLEDFWQQNNLWKDDAETFDVRIIL